MLQSRTYHGITLDIAKTDSGRVCYLLFPEGLKDEAARWMEQAAERYSVNIVMLSGMEWNDVMTPWSAFGVMKKEKPFGGHADLFLKDLREDYFPAVEALLGLRKPERSLVGISLSGLFSIWCCFKCDFIRNFASISGSLWFDKFNFWAEDQPLSPSVGRVFLSLGDREKKSKDKRMATVEDATLQVVESLSNKGADVRFHLEKNSTHFSPVVPRLELAMEELFSPAETA